MIARNVNDPRTLANLAKDFLDNVVVRLRPVPRPLQTPAVDDIADEVDRLCFGVFEEVEEKLSLAAASSEVQVRDPNRAVIGNRCEVGHRAPPPPSQSGCIE